MSGLRPLNALNEWGFVQNGRNGRNIRNILIAWL
jgi:hypothetical protein